ncbi:MAG TPA: condensation domain-containing protein [Pilimelia sp.]|nr:condensation domain-containing protein [Pilimelia sp.]
MTAEATGVQIRVPFAGWSAREGPLTLGQRNVLRWMRDVPPDSQDLMLPVAVPVPAGATLDTVTAVVRELARRHESLRTTLSDTDGGDVRQRVAGSGELVIVRYEGGATPDDLLPDVVAGLTAKGIHPELELPLRAAVVTGHGTPRHLVLAVSHLAVDAASAELLRRQLTRLLAPGGAQAPYPLARQPVDQAEIEATPQVRARLDRAVGYWRTRLERAPQAMFAVPAHEPGRAAYRAVRLRSRALALAASAVAARTRTGRATAVLAAVSAVVGHHAGQADCVVVAVAGNRQAPELRGYVGQLAQDALITVSLSPAPFDEFVRRVWAASLNAYRHSQFDAVRLWRVIDEVGERRGTKFARDLVFNDLSGYAPAPAAPAADAADLAAALADTELAWLPAAALPVRLICYVNRLDPDRAELVVWADVRRLPADRLAEAVRGVERLLVEAATRQVDLADIGAISGLSPVERGAGWHLVDACWVELAEVRRLVADALPAYQSGVFVTADAGEPRLVAYLAAAGRPLDPRDAHQACLAALPGRSTAMAPRRYVVCDGPPPTGVDVAAWRALPVIAEGSGRP